MKQLPYYTQFVTGESAEVRPTAAGLRRALGEYLQTCAAKGWRVEASDAAEPDEGVVYHVRPDDLAAPPVGVTAELHEVELAR